MRFFYKLAYLLLLNYWYLFRPQYRGVHCLILHRRHVLLLRHTYGLGFWEVPGGGLNRGETALTAILREIKEEVGLTPSKITPLGHYTTLHEYKIDHVQAFTARVSTSKFILTSPEILDAKWFPLNQLQTGRRLVTRPPHLSPHVQNILHLYARRSE